VLTGIKDKFDTKTAEQLVLVGYPKNKDHLCDMLFWSCFPNDPVCWITYPYMQILRDEILVETLESFIKFHLGNSQEKLVQIACEEFLSDERESLIPLILYLTECPKVKAWFES